MLSLKVQIIDTTFPFFFWGLITFFPFPDWKDKKKHTLRDSIVVKGHRGFRQSFREQSNCAS